MMQDLPLNAALLVVDVQKGFDDPYWGTRNNCNAEAQIARLLTAWRQTGRPIIHVQHMSTNPKSPLRPHQPGNEFKDMVKPMAGEPVFEKQVNSSFIGTNLEKYLRENDVDTLVIVGLSTDHCISTTTRMAGNLGFDTYVVADATATFNRTAHDGTRFSAEQVHEVALASLHGEFATVCNTSDFFNKLGLERVTLV
jgi:nicotinamidase-related amidase